MNTSQNMTVYIVFILVIIAHVHLLCIDPLLNLVLGSYIYTASQYNYINQLIIIMLVIAFSCMNARLLFISLMLLVLYQISETCILCSYVFRTHQK